MTAPSVCAQGEGRIDYDEFVAVISKSWERAEETDRLSAWLKKHYTRLDSAHEIKHTEEKIFQSSTSKERKHETKLEGGVEDALHRPLPLHQEPRQSQGHWCGTK